MEVIIIITAAMLATALIAYAFKVFWKDILRWIAKKIAEAIIIIGELTDAFIRFVRRNGKAVAFLIKHYLSGRKTRTEIDEIDEELCPDEVQEALKEGKEVRVHNIK